MTTQRAMEGQRLMTRSTPNTGDQRDGSKDVLEVWVILRFSPD